MTEVNNAYKHKNGICEFGIEKRKITHCKRLQNSPVVQLHKHYWPENLGGFIGETPESLCFAIQKVQKLDT